MPFVSMHGLLLQVPQAISYLKGLRHGSAEPEDGGYGSFKDEDEEEEVEDLEETIRADSDDSPKEVVRVGEFQFDQSVENQLGTGAFGDVFRGKQAVTGREVAIKRIPDHQIKPNELLVLEALNSDFLVNLLGHYQGSEFSYLIMELCDTDLSQHMSQKPFRMPEHIDEFTSSSPDEIRFSRGIQMQLQNLSVVLDNLARGYEVLHREKIVHRDIKPQNILLKYCQASDGDTYPLISAAKITDFGISRIIGEEQDLSNVAGTLLYMAPEIGANLLTHQQYDSKVDMWSIGCVIYQCLTGEAPFDERSLCKLFLSSAGGNYAAFKNPAVPKETPKEIENVLDSLLEIDYEKRMGPLDFLNSVAEKNS